MLILTLLPNNSKPFNSTLLYLITSILPPDTIKAIFSPFLYLILLAKIAAVGIAPAPSAITFPSYESVAIPLMISSSVTVTISSTKWRMISNVIVPGVLTAHPSANVGTPVA